MQIVEFYRGNRGNQNDDYLEQMLTWTDGALEMDHDWVQWAFPSNEPSMLNGESPVLSKAESEAFEADPELQVKVQHTFNRFLEFLGFEMTCENDVVEIKTRYDGLPLILQGFNHNMLRITRVLKSLRLTGNTRYAVAFYDALRPFKSCFSPNTWSYWEDAVFQPLW